MEEKFNLLGIYTYADLLENMRRGLKFGKLEEYRDGTKTISTRLQVKNGLIYWCNFGSSANAATARDMEFVITRIFKTTLDEFIRSFIWFY